MAPCGDENELAADEDFAVWPFRRQLVYPDVPLVYPDVPLGAATPPRPRVEDTQPITIVPLAVPRAASPLRLAVPLAVAAFCAAMAGTAKLAASDGGDAGARLPAAVARPAATPAAALHAASVLTSERRLAATTRQQRPAR